MTYPPQQPGQYGQQPGQYGQQPGQYGQQPAQYGQPSGQYGQFGQPPPYGQEPPGTPPPRKNRPGVIAAVVAGAVLVLGGAGTGIYFMTKSNDPKPNSAGSGQTASELPSRPGELPGGPGSASVEPPAGSSAEQPNPPAQPGGGGGPADPAILDVAKKYAKAVSDKDEGTVKSLTCNHDTGVIFDAGAKLEVTGQPEMITEDSATVDGKVSLAGADPIDGFPLLLNRSGKTWCVQ